MDGVVWGLLLSGAALLHGGGKQRGAGVMVILIMTMMKVIMTDIY